MLTTTILSLLATTLAVPEPGLRLGGGAFRTGAVINRAQLSPDGRWFAVVGPATELHLMDATTGRVVRSWKAGSPLLAFNFDDEGGLHAFEKAGTVTRFDLRPEPQPPRRFQIATATPPNLAWIPPGGKFLVVFLLGAREHWNLRTGERLRIDTDGRDPEAGNLTRSSRDGRWFCWIDREPPPGFAPERDPRKYRCWLSVRDLSGGPEPRVFPLPFWPQDLAFLPGQAAALLQTRSETHRLDLATGRLAPHPMDEQAHCTWNGYQMLTDFSPDGRRAAGFHISPAGHYYVREWDLATGRLLHRHLAPRRDWWELHYTPSSRLLAWKKDGQRLQAVAPTEGWGRPTSGHSANLCDLRFTADGRLLESLDVDGDIVLWDLTSGQPLCRENTPAVELKGRLAPARGLGHRPGTVLLDDGHFGVGLRYDRSTGAIEPLSTGAPHRSHLGGWESDDRKEPVRLRHGDTGKLFILPPLAKIWPDRPDRMPHPPQTPPEGDILALHYECTACDATSCEQIQLVATVRSSTRRVLARWHTRRPYELALPWRPPVLSPDGKWLTLPAEGEANLYDPLTGGLLERIEPDGAGGPVVPLAFSPDSRNLLVFSAPAQGTEGSLELVELATLRPRRRWNLPGVRLPGIASWNNNVLTRFSPDGRVIACPLQDNTILLLNADVPGSPVPEGELAEALASRDPARANRAVRTLAARADARRWVEARNLLEPPDVPGVAALLRDLDHDTPSTRERAYDRLLRLPLARLREVRPPAGSSLHLRHLLDRLREEASPAKAVTGEELRRLRVQEALERCER